MGVGADGCGRALLGCDGVGCAVARAPGTFGADGRGGGGTTGVGRETAGVCDTGREPSGVLRANGATPGVGRDGVGARAGGGCGRGTGLETGVAVARPSLKSFSIAPAWPIVMTPPQTLQRARTPAAGIFAGSTRKTERHSGQETFISDLRSPAGRVAAQPPRQPDRDAGRRRTRSRGAFSRSSSSR